MPFSQGSRPSYNLGRGSLCLGPTGKIRRRWWNIQIFSRCFPLPPDILAKNTSGPIINWTFKGSGKVRRTMAMNVRRWLPMLREESANIRRRSAKVLRNFPEHETPSGKYPRRYGDASASSCEPSPRHPREGLLWRLWELNGLARERSEGRLSPDASSNVFQVSHWQLQTRQGNLPYPTHFVQHHFVLEWACFSSSKSFCWGIGTSCVVACRWGMFTE